MIFFDKEALIVTPANAGVQGKRRILWLWVPPCAGMTILFEATLL
jgi:hypothetical protein